LNRQPPDLSQPYGTKRERDADREAVLVLYWYAIDQLTRLAEQPANQWSPEQAALFPGSVPSGPPEPPQHRLQRWLTVYGDEIRTVKDIRNKLVHLQPVADSELRGAVYLARHVIASAVGVPPSGADSAARRVLALAS
jgi:hypothetical protein